MFNSIAFCLQAPVGVPDMLTFEEWADHWFTGAQAKLPQIDIAIRTAFGADRMSWVFASAYQSALRVMVPDAPSDEMLSLCVSEAAGNHPRDIQTRIQAMPSGRLRVNGHKRWAMIGLVPTTLLIVGLTDPGFRGQYSTVRVAKVSVGSVGLTVQETQITSFIPEVPHCAVDLKNVEIEPETLLPGDGYYNYVKPFRTLEDLFIAASTLAYLLRVARVHLWPTDYIERVAATLSVLRGFSNQSPLEALTHVVLSGSLRLVSQLRIEATELWRRTGGESSQRWDRDCALFNVAEVARQMRRQRAWEKLHNEAASEKQSTP